MAPQPVDDPVTVLVDEILTEGGVEAPSARRPARRSKALPMDPRRAPGAIAGSPQTAEGKDVLRADDPAPIQAPPRGIAAGTAVIREALRTMPSQPGVYRMLDRKSDGLYVGKARNLKNRVQNYAHPIGLSNRLRRMIAETAAIEVVVTHTEAEALLLECNMIKRLMPRYNVLLRDD
jgi:excinuclease ABC subunit C